MKAQPSEYEVEFFREQGFKRYKCSVCGANFWSKVPRRTCEDAPCSPYTFLTEKLSTRALRLSEARESFLKFFEERGHERVEPRPVVARWREDLYLTIASIVVFQPHVTSGIVPPPANPLVISQPCIRLEDIDHVGYTLGRHLTGFEMAAHHAFNYPDKMVYWKNETVKLAFEYFTSVIGIPEEVIVFKESWWEGGGNAGPCFEVVAGGLELATLVFMKYKVVNGEYVEMPMKIVDTGYGVERITWFTQRAATGFHAIYGSLVSDYAKILGVELDEEVLKALSVKAALIDPSNPATVERVAREVSEQIGVNYKDILDLVEKARHVFTLLDHGRTIAWMLADGIVPSNTGEGYLARLVIRRALRALSLLQADVSFAELVEMQVKYWSKEYPKLVLEKDYVLDAIRVEEERFSAVLRRAESIVAKILKKKKTLSLDDLILLYDSHGIPPEIASNIAKKRGVLVEVPANFYEVVAARHGASSTIVRRSEKTKLPQSIAEWAHGLKPTRLMFHEDPYLKSFEAKVEAVKEEYVVLDKTAFYPEGGGQKCDEGIIYSPNGETYKVLYVGKVGDVVVHKLDRKPNLKPGDEVKCVIDWSRRYRLMKHHTATHIVLAAARSVLGRHVWQAGAEKDVDKARLDITHHKALTEEELKLIEREANRIVELNIDVRTCYMDRNEAEAKYGFTLYQGGVPLGPKIRIVEIPNVDVEACFGTHVSRTGELGGIKIIKADKIQDGVIRLEYVAGTSLVDYTSRLAGTLAEVARTLGSSVDDVEKRARTIVEEQARMKRMISKYREKLLSMLIQQILGDAKDVDGVRLYLAVDEIGDPELRRKVLIDATSKDPRLVLVMCYSSERGLVVEVSVGQEAVKKVRADQLVRALSSIGGRGGGRENHAVCTVKASFEEVKQEVEKIVKRICSSERTS